MQFCKLAEVGVPNIGVMSVGELENTKLPEPVLSVITVENSEGD